MSPAEQAALLATLRALQPDERVPVQAGVLWS
jgi:hypothetical protein